MKRRSHKRPRRYVTGWEIRNWSDALAAVFCFVVGGALLGLFLYASVYMAACSKRMGPIEGKYFIINACE